MKLIKRLTDSVNLVVKRGTGSFMIKRYDVKSEQGILEVYI